LSTWSKDFDLRSWVFNYASPVLEMKPTSRGILGWVRGTEFTLAKIYESLSELEALSNQKHLFGISPIWPIH
jgi:hypothetical protein